MAKRPQRPKFLWNNAYLEKLAIELGDECIFLCLSPVSFRMLADMSKMLLWATRYEEGAVAELGKTAYRELNVPCLTDFYSLLDELNNKDWLQSQFDDLGSRMTELEDMDVIVNQTVNGGCGCGCDGESTSTTQTTSGGIIIDPDDTGITPPYDTEPAAIVDSVRCRAANYLAVSFVSALRRLEQMGDEAGALVVLVGVIALAVTALSPILGDEVIAWSAFVRWAYKAIRLRSATGFSSAYFRVLADNIENDFHSFVCAVYTWDTAEELGAAFILWINARVDELQAQVNIPTETALLYKEFINAVYGAEAINWFVENIASVAPADFVPQYDCLCGATGDTCPTQNIVLAGLGNFPAGDLTGTTQGFASEFNSQTGYHEIIFELDANYCVTIENGAYTPSEAHEKCSDGVMVASDGSCIRRFVARSGDAFGTAVTFDEQTLDCSCLTMDGEFFVDLYKGETIGFTNQTPIIKGETYILESESDPYGNQVLDFYLWHSTGGTFQQYIKLISETGFVPVNTCSSQEAHNKLWSVQSQNETWVGDCVMPDLDAVLDGGIRVRMVHAGTVNQRLTLSWEGAYKI